MAAMLAAASSVRAEDLPNPMDRTDWDFEILKDGRFLYFTVTDMTNNYVKLMHEPDFNYSGNIDVPSQVTVTDEAWIESKNQNLHAQFLNKTFTVTEISNGAFWSILNNPNYENIGTITIPASVTNIHPYAFYNSSASSVIINGNVSEIKNNSFEGCPNLTSVTLPATVTSIGQDAFKDCSKIKTVNYRSSLYAWCNIDFSSESANPLAASSTAELYCYNQKVENLVIPDYVYTLKNYAFAGANIKSLDLNSVYSIGEKCFNGASNLGELTLSTDITAMGTDAFSGTNITKLNYNIPSAETLSAMPYTPGDITTLTIGSNVKKIASCAFRGAKISSITLPEGLTWIGFYAFENCKDLRSISIPDGVSYIGDCAFRNCGLESVKLPENLTIILTGTFESNPYLASIDIPANVYQIGDVAFSGCTSLKALTLNNVQKYFGYNVFKDTDIQTLNYNIENAERLEIMPYEPSKLTSVTIGPKTKVIAANAFSGSKITSIEIPTNVTKISSDAFSGTAISEVKYKGSLAEWCNIEFVNRAANPMCNSTSGGTTSNTSDLYIGGQKIENLVVPSGVTTLKNNAFFHASFKSIDLGGVKSIGKETFSGCKNLTSVTLPASVSSLGGWAFAECSNLAEVTSLNTTPPTLANNEVFKDTKSGLIAKVALNSYLDYKNADNWVSQYSTVIPMSGTLALTDDVEYKIDKDVSGCELSYTRTVSSDSWMGVYLPFDVDVTAVEGTFATLTGVSTEDVLEWTTVSSGKIDACTPFIFKPTVATTITFSASEATLHPCTESHPTTFDGYTLYGTFTTKSDMAAIKGYALSAGNFYYTTDPTKTLKPYRIFLTVPETKNPNNAPIRSRINGEDVTGIDEIEFEAQPISDGNAYNLQGVRVGLDYKGIVIVNGKKVIRK